MSDSKVLIKSKLKVIKEFNLQDGTSFFIVPKQEIEISESLFTGEITQAISKGELKIIEPEIIEEKSVVKMEVKNKR